MPAHEHPAATPRRWRVSNLDGEHAADVTAITAKDAALARLSNSEDALSWGCVEVREILQVDVSPMGAPARQYEEALSSRMHRYDIHPTNHGIQLKERASWFS